MLFVSKSTAISITAPFFQKNKDVGTADLISFRQKCISRSEAAVRVYLDEPQSVHKGIQCHAEKK